MQIFLLKFYKKINFYDYSYLILDFFNKNNYLFDYYKITTTHKKTYPHKHLNRFSSFSTLLYLVQTRFVHPSFFPRKFMTVFFHQGIQ